MDRRQQVGRHDDLPIVVETGCLVEPGDIDGLADDSGSGAGNLESYSFLGASTIVTRTRGNNTSLTYVTQTGDTHAPVTTSFRADSRRRAIA